MSVPSVIRVLGCLAAIFVVTVNGGCVERIEEIKKVFPRLDETQQDVVIVNITNEKALTWTFDISSVDGLPIDDVNIKTDLLNKFINVTVTETHVMLMVVEPLNKEYFCRLYNKVLDSFEIDISCKDPSNITIPLPFRVINTEVNEFPTDFKTKPLSITIPESTPTKSVLKFINSTLTDLDCPPRLELNTITITNYTVDPQVNGADIFTIRLGSVGDVILSKAVDFDQVYATRQPVYYMVVIEVTDAENGITKTDLRINITDVNDLPPAFDGFTYTAHTSVYHRGKLTVTPSPIHAVDQDYSIDCAIVYSIVHGGGFDIDSATGEITQILDMKSHAKVIQIQATENCKDMSSTPLFSTVPLLIILSNQTVDLPPPLSGKSTGEEGSTDLKLILIIITVVAAVVIAALIIGFIVYHKRMSRTVTPNVDRPETPRTEEEDLGPDSERSESKEVLLDPRILPIPSGRNGLLPPLNMKSTGTETERKKKRSRRRKKIKEPEIYDGTKEYDMAADPEFFNSSQKDKIKRSARSKDSKTTDPNRRINVKNEH